MGEEGFSSGSNDAAASSAASAAAAKRRRTLAETAMLNPAMISTIEEGDEDDASTHSHDDSNGRAFRFSTSSPNGVSGAASPFSGDHALTPPAINSATAARLQDSTFLFERSLTLSSRDSAVSASSGGSGTRVVLETSLKKEAAEKAAARDARERENPPIYLCCSQQEPEDFQVDVCPRSWFNLREANGFLDAMWKLLVICCCLPCCYPCYLTKRCRRKTKRVLEPSNMQDSSPHKQSVYVIKATKVDALQKPKMEELS